MFFGARLVDCGINQDFFPVLDCALGPALVDHHSLPCGVERPRALTRVRVLCGQLDVVFGAPAARRTTSRLAGVGLLTGHGFVEHGEGGIEDLAGLVAPCFAGLVHGRGGEGEDLVEDVV
jgi:hypothetical protein